MKGKEEHRPRRHLSSAAGAKYPPGKKALFTVITLAIPIAILVLSEILLRIAHYKANLDSLVVIKRFQGKDYYSINPEISKRYFASHNVGIPEPYEEVFEVYKSPETFRIFCLGESTMYGYPYPANVTAPRFLKDRLTTLFPSRKFEVINLGIPAVSSAVVLDILKEAVRYQPDLFIIYSGHNEFYGTYGVASTEYLGHSNRFLDIYMQLRKLKLFLLMREAILSLQSEFASNEPATRRATYLERMVRDKYISYGSSKYLTAKELLEDDLCEMVKIARERGVPILFSTLVSNWKDLVPFISLFSPTTPEGDQRRWEELFQQGLELERSGIYEKASDKYRRALDIDSARADGHYQLARCYLKMERFQEARSEFVKAKDFDVLRFRATSEFNDIIRRVGALDGAGYIDLERMFAENSPHGIIGGELVTEHLHPNDTGYFLMGKAFCHSLAEYSQIASRAQWPWARDKEDAEYLQMAEFTNLDLETANIRIQILKSAWPFRENPESDFTFTPSIQLQSVAFSYCQKEITWPEAHYQMAAYYVKQKRYDLAALEYKAVAKELYLFYHPRMLLGDMQVLLLQYEEAEKNYGEALELHNNQFVHMRLGTLYLKQGKIDDAITHLTTAIQLDADATSKLTDDVRAMTMYSLGVAYEKKGDIPSARVQMQRILSFSPGNRMATEFLLRLGSK